MSNKLTHAGVAKRSILQLANTKNLCLSRSLVVARIYSERGNLREGELHKRWNSVRYRTSSLQRELALELTRKAGIAIPAEGCGIREIERFQRVLLEENILIKICIVTPGTGRRTFPRSRLSHTHTQIRGAGAPRKKETIYKKNERFNKNNEIQRLHQFKHVCSRRKTTVRRCRVTLSLAHEPAHQLNIMYYEDSRHYNPILNLTAAAGSRGGFCTLCNKGYRNERGHRCAKRCPRCYATPICETRGAAIVACDACNRTFFGPACFERHRMEKSYDGKSCESVCKSVRNCDGCGRFVKTASSHNCHELYCRLCRSKQPANHRCFMHPFKQKAINNNFAQAGTSTASEPTEENDVTNNDARNRIAFIFYDFETRQDVSLEG
ncbi:uncharacterized protein [Cardiocondyla obscurior]|uniref:uncharacterized protein n=1 Tax=Cardiocondyla obscurior TaxID=286306 RepID=UPI0039657E63